MQSLSDGQPSVGPYCRARAAPSAAMLRHEGGHVLGREGRRVGQAAGQRDDLGRSVIAIRSRMAEEFMTCVRAANSAA